MGEEEERGRKDGPAIPEVHSDRVRPAFPSEAGPALSAQVQLTYQSERGQSSMGAPEVG